MKKYAAACLSILSAAVPALALETPEALRRLSLKALSATAIAPVLKINFTASRYEHISGFVTLRGTEYVREGETSARVRLDGSASLHGSGGITTGSVRFDESVTVRFNDTNANVSDTVYLTEWVNVYKNGRYVGRASVSGSIRVSGRVSGNWLRLDGSGSVSGGLMVREEKKQP